MVVLLLFVDMILQVKMNQILCCIYLLTFAIIEMEHQGMTMIDKCFTAELCVLYAKCM